MTLKTRGRAIFRSRGSSEEPTLPDPAAKFPHPANAELFSFLKKRIETSGSRADWTTSDFPFRTYPDLIDRFRSLAPTADVIQGSAYGCAIMANTFGVVFAWAGGMNQIFLRLPPTLHEQALTEIGRHDPTYGGGWIEFLAFGGRIGTRVDPLEALPRWIRIAHDESLKAQPV